MAARRKYLYLVGFFSSQGNGTEFIVASRPIADRADVENIQGLIADQILSDQMKVKDQFVSMTEVAVFSYQLVGTRSWRRSEYTATQDFAIDCKV
jgi:hypothetical protein